MAKRGRPRHPDVLTPREWDVLALLREELSNEEIARRLEITERTAKYHVSEILSKLAVASREEAAAWQPSRRPWWAVAGAPLAFLWRKAPLGSLSTVASAATVGVLTAALAGLGLLAVLLVRSDGDGSPVAPANAAIGETIAFSLEGSIYTVKPDGSNLRKVLDGSAEGVANSAPEISPDGTRVAYIVDRRRVVVATSDFSTTLADVDLFVDRTPPTPIASNFSMGPVAVHWSPDGTKLLVSRRRLGGSGVSDVVLMDKDGENQKTLLESSAFIEATWFEQLPPTPGAAIPRILVAGYEGGIDARLFDLAGNDVGPGVPQGSAFYAVASHAEPGGERVLVAPALGSPEPYGPIVLWAAGLRPPDDTVITAGGCGATWSPAGERIAFYDGFGIAIKDVEAEPGAQELIVPNERLGITPETHTVVGPEGHITEVCAGLGISWWSATRPYRDEELGVALEYPAAWKEGAPPTPYASCYECAVFGPREAGHPYGVQVFAQDFDLDGPECGGQLGGCPVTAFVGNRAIPRAEQRQMEIAGGPAWQQEIERQAPLGLASETGDYTPYREVWTVLPLGDRSLFLVAFWRDGDEDARRETLASYEAMLGSLRVE